MGDWSKNVATRLGAKGVEDNDNIWVGTALVIPTVQRRRFCVGCVSV